jgi:L-threonylcarbamoyladenylate synthase
VGLENGEVFIYRLGGLDVKDIERTVGKVKIMTHSSSNPKSPGMLKSHYAPKKTFVLGDLELLVEEYLSRGIPFAVLSFSDEFKNVPQALQIQLSQNRDVNEAAKKLFASMRALDTMDVSLILSELLPEQGLGRAINDRLRRAAVMND